MEQQTAHDHARARTEEPRGEHPRGEHPRGEHPRGEHPRGKEPRGEERREALRRYRILDTPPEESFDRVTQMAARLCEVPTALISLIDGERLWFKSRFGFDACEAPVKGSFDLQAVRRGETLVVEDAAEDARFRDYPLVSGKEPGVRFYAGAPLTTPGGLSIGTLCVMDDEPRAFDADRRATLEDLAAITAAALERRGTEAHYRTLVENVQEVVFQTNLNGQATFLSAAWERITGLSAEDALGASLLGHAHPQDRAESLKAFAPLLNREETLCRHRARFMTEGGDAVPMQFRVRLLTDDDGRPTGTVGTLTPLSRTDAGEDESSRTPPESSDVPLFLPSDAFDAPEQAVAPPIFAIEESTPPNAFEGAFTLENPEEQDGEPHDGPEQNATTAIDEEDESGDTEEEEANPHRTWRHENIFSRAPRYMGDDISPLAGEETLADVRRRLGAESPELRRTTFDFAEHLRAVLGELEPAARRKGLALRRTFPRRPLSIEADPGALDLLVTVLVSNAITSTEEGSISVSARAEPAPEEGEGDDSVCLRVADTSADIPKSLLNSLLDVDADDGGEDDPRGQVAFVHRLVNLMQGSVEMKSRRGRGTVFTVVLPRAVFTTDAPSDAPSEQDSKTAGSGGGTGGPQGSGSSIFASSSEREGDNFPPVTDFGSAPSGPASQDVAPLFPFFSS